ncbi:chitinase-3-like protein 1 [Penaeus vannamei]|uniref:chitinase-3-like protein 1 n=1 Tax=Penaeus vannamei TaxID=6689 RepID=UPI00387F5E22
MRTLVVATFFVLAGLCLSGSAEAVTICYFGSWAVWRQGAGRYDVGDIDPFLCTHLIYGFAEISTATWEVEAMEPYNDLCVDYGQCAYSRFTALKNLNPDLKTILSVGGNSVEGSTFSQLSEDASRRKIFVNSAVEMLKNYSFDGLDINWMHPTGEGGQPEDKENYIALLRDLHGALADEDLLLTACVSLKKPVVDVAYDVPELSDVVDFVMLNGYNLHGPWHTFTHHHAPLFAHPADTGANALLSIDYGVRYWISKGVDKTKLVLGLSTYGTTWTLNSLDNTGYYAYATQAGKPGPYTATLGILGYNEICELQHGSDQWTVVRDPAMHEPYAYSTTDKTWCGYEDSQSLWRKGQYARSQGLAGVMVWSLETDDFSGSCTGRPYNLIRSMTEGFLDLPFSTPVPPTSATTQTTSGLATPACGDEYFVPDLYCNKYWQCEGGTPHPRECPEGLVWNTAQAACTWPFVTDTAHCLMPGQTMTPPATATPTAATESSTSTSETSTKSTSHTSSTVSLSETSAPTSQTPSTTAPSASPASTTTITTAPIPPDCDPASNYFVSHQSCKKFWWCVEGRAVLGTCYGDLVWDQDARVCVSAGHRDTADCGIL